MSDHKHNQQESCQTCQEISINYGNIFNDILIRQDKYANLVVGPSIKMPKNDNIDSIAKNKPMSASEKLQYFLINYIKCFLITLIGNFTFGFFQHFTEFKLYPKYIFFMASFLFTAYDFTTPGYERDTKVTNLIGCLIIYSLMLSALMLQSRKIYAYEKSMKGNKQYFQYYVDKFLRIKSRYELNSFLDFVGEQYQQDNIKISMQQNKSGMLWKIAEIAIFNLLILIVILLAGHEQPLTFLQIVFFQLFFSFSILTEVNEQILGAKEFKKDKVEKTKNFFLSEFMEIEDVDKNQNAQIQEEHKSKLPLMKIKKKNELIANVVRKIQLDCLVFEYSRDVAGVTTTIYIITLFTMGFILLLSNFGFLLWYLKRDIYFLCLYLTYMIYMLINITVVLFKKNTINSSIKYLINFIEEQQIEAIQNKVNNDFLITIGKLEDSQDSYENGQMKLNVAKQIEDLEQKSQAYAQEMSKSIHSKAILEDVYKEQAERLLIFIKVKPKFIYKFILIIVIGMIFSVVGE